MEIIPRSVWKPLRPLGKPAPLPVGQVWLHHDDSSRPPTDPAGEREQMLALERTGFARFGSTISYTFVVFPSGRVYEGHGVDRQGTHTFRRNRTSRAIVVAGNFEKAKPTPAALESIAQLLVHGAGARWWTSAALAGGHKDVIATACPGKNLYCLIGDINTRAAQIVADPTSMAGQPLDDGDDDMRVLVKIANHSPVYVTNGITRRWVRTKGELKELVKLGLVDNNTVHELSHTTVKAIPLIGPEAPNP